MELVQVPAGELMMGSDPANDTLADDDEQPQHPATLADFYIGKQEVTNAQYAAFVEATGHATPDHWGSGRVPEGKEDHPVVNVSWNDAVAFTQWLGEETGMAFRLCTEAEWEKACRGTESPIYPWGDTFDPDKANTYEGGEAGPTETTPVGSYSPAGDSPYGVADMAGNVWEWTSSLYRDYPYDPDDGREDLTISGSRVLRGGSFGNSEGRARCAYRYPSSDLVPVYHWDHVGFRVCASPGLSTPGLRPSGTP
jgi:formylglycine-generating enzyme required for sulfatase activity